MYTYVERGFCQSSEEDQLEYPDSANHRRGAPRFRWRKLKSYHPGGGGARNVFWMVSYHNTVLISIYHYKIIEHIICNGQWLHIADLCLRSFSPDITSHGIIVTFSVDKLLFNEPSTIVLQMWDIIGLRVVTKNLGQYDKPRVLGCEPVDGVCY